MKKIFLFFCFLLFNGITYSQELRATWIARDQLNSKDAIALAIDSIKLGNFNTIYVNVWSRGYPLWPSEVFYSHTGIYIDPAYEGRDILGEVIAEAHRAKLHVEAWFEYGFVGGYEQYYPGNSGKGKIFDVHPEWIAKKVDGSEKDNSNFYWMVQTRKDVQDFLIALVMEIVRKYDIDGIELDRIRYSNLQYGYDVYTDSLYRAEHNGMPPPLNYSDQNWIRWRADKLNEFHARVYDSVKSVNPRLNLSNAPSLYSSSSYTSYLNFCQDWAWWVNNNKVDNVQLQVYVNNPSNFSSILDYASTLVNEKSKIYPSFAVSPGNSTLTLDEIIQFIDITRNKGFKGNGIWYSNDLRGFYSALKNLRYQQKTFPPFSTADWREFSEIVSISDTNNAKRFGNWQQSLIYGFDGPTYFTFGGDSASVSYYFDVPVEGYYDVYAFIVPAPDQANPVIYSLFDSFGNEINTYVDQTNVLNKRWYKLGTAYLTKGRKLVAILSNYGVSAIKKVRADAMYIKLNRKLSPNASTKIESDKKDYNDKKLNLKSYPNPFNSSTIIEFTLNENKSFDLYLYNLLGELVYSYKGYTSNFSNRIKIDSANLSNGIYICTLKSDNQIDSIKLVVLK